MRCIGKLNDVKLGNVSYYRTGKDDNRELFTSKVISFGSDDALKSIKHHGEKAIGKVKITPNSISLQTDLHIIDDRVIDIIMEMNGIDKQQIKKPENKPKKGILPNGKG